MKYLPKISVIIPTYNRAFLLKECLLSLNHQTYPRDAYEVIVVDDGSTDVTYHLMHELIREELQYKILYVRQENGGPAKARNLGIRNAKGDLITFTDDDCVADESWLERLSKAFTQPFIAGVGGRVLAKGKGFFSEYLDFKHMLEPRQTNGDIDFLVTANACYRKEMVVTAGGFDERIANPGGEDPDLSFKITASNEYKLIFEPKAVVWHHFNESLHSFLRMSYNYGRGAKFLYKRWGTRFCRPFRTEIIAYHVLTGIKNIPLQFAYFLIRKRLGFRKSLLYSLIEWIGHIYYMRGFRKGY